MAIEDNYVYKALTVRYTKQCGSRYFWMVEQTYSKGPNTAWAPSNKGLLPISYNAGFTDIGAFWVVLNFTRICIC